MFQRSYCQMNECIAPDGQLQKKVLEKATSMQRTRFRPMAAAAVAALLVIMVSVPVMAYYVPAVNDLMYYVSPEMAERFTPVQKSDKDQGIVMEVISVSVHENVVEVCLSLEDTEGDRIGARSYASDVQIREIERFSGWGYTASILEYDEQTGKVYCMIVGTAFTDGVLADAMKGKLTITVNSIASSGAEDIQGKWRVTCDVTESSYTSPEDPYDFIVPLPETE